MVIYIISFSLFTLALLATLQFILHRLNIL